MTKEAKQELNKTGEEAETQEDASEIIESEEQQDAATQEEGAPEENEELKRMTAERDDYLNGLIRERADFENYKKRNASAVAKAYADGQTDMAALILPVADNLERALQVGSGDQNEEGIRKGVEMTAKMLRDILKNMGVEEIDALGKEFDPNFHNAVMQEEAEEGEKSGTVKEVLMKGYKINDKVLRHSMVKVIK